MNKSTIYMVGMIAYVFLLITIGFLAKRRVKNAEDFQVGGQNIPTLVLAGTLVASWLGSGTVVGYASRVYYFGLGGIWYAVACVFSVIYFYFIIGRIRSIPALTTPQMLGLRYGTSVRKWATIPVFLGQATIAAYQIKAVGYIFQIALGINADTAMVLSTAIIIGYTVLGGFYAVAWSDVCQSCIFLVGISIAVPFAISNAGGWSNMLTSLPEGFLSVSNVSLLGALGVFVPTALLGGTSMFMYQRAWAAESIPAAKRGALITIFGAIFVYSLVLILALTAVVTLPGIKGDVVIFSIANQLPIFIGLILTISALAVFVSTGDSLLLAASTVFVREFYMHNKAPDPKKELAATRITVIAIGVSGLLLLRFYPNLISLALLAYSVEGAGLLCPLVAGMYWKGGTEKGALASIICGLTIVISWEILNRSGVAFAQQIHSALVAVPVAAIAYFVVSLMTKKDMALVNTFFANFEPKE